MKEDQLVTLSESGEEEMAEDSSTKQLLMGNVQRLICAQTEELNESVEQLVV